MKHFHVCKREMEGLTLIIGEQIRGKMETSLDTSGWFSMDTGKMTGVRYCPAMNLKP